MMAKILQKKFLSATFNTSMWETNIQILRHRINVTEVSAYEKLQQEI